MQFLWKAGRENEALGMLIRKLEAGGAGGFQIHSWVRRELGKLDGAGFEGLLSHPLMRESMDPKLLSIAGSLADEEGRKEEARRFYERALEIDPRDIEALIWKFKMVEENEVDWTIFKGVGSVDLIRHLLGVDHVDQITNQLGERECGALVYFVKHLPDEVRQSQLLRWLFKACWLKPEIAPVILKEMVSYPRFAAKTASSLEKLEEGGLIERGVVVEILNEGILKAGNRKVVNLYFERLLRLGQEDLESKFSEAVLTHMKRVSPFRYQSYVVTEAMSQAGADVDGLFRGWREGLPEEKWLRVTVIRDFTAWLIIRDLSLGEWWKEHQILLSEVVTDDRFYNEGGLDLRSWLGWIHRKLGQDGVTQSLINFAEVTIGPSSEWKTLRKLNWQEVPAQYVKGAHEFWMLFTHLSRDEALVPLIELAFEDQRLSEVSAIMKAGLK